ncbi:MAG TPA: acetoacetate--CoA ligase [Geodermatophilus sp.]|nr:acetoacetate--CoA ligase [Geodermatophilus sp.]
MTLAPTRTQLALFRARCEEVAGVALDAPGALHAFSVRQPDLFWRTLLDWTGLPWSGSADVVRTGDDVETARFFPGVRLNYAEALLRPLPGVPDDAPAVTAVHSGRAAETLSRGRLRAEVGATAAALAEAGLRAGDRVVLVAPHTAGTIVVALAAAALGAPVSTAAPDMGATALLGRFEQVEPAFLVLDRAATGAGTAEALLAGLPTVRRLVVLDELPLPGGALPADRLADLVVAAGPSPEWERRPFDAPLFVMFSSGTTGPPKAMVHGAGGTLLEHVKEHRLHGDLTPADTLYFHTTTAWMMWNWQLSALAVGAHVVTYDGPVTGPETLWQLVAEHGVTVFGTSPAYLQLCQDAGYRPAAAVDLSRLRAVLSTGAVLHDWQFDWVAEHVGPVPLQSISGGTDILGCFVLGSPELPVRRGRSQVRSLGLDVAAVDEDGGEVVGAVGELVCRNPFPSRPVGFLRDPDGARFHASYFAEHPGVWTHGDLVDIDPDGSARVHGRSDGVLNVDGVRIGPSEIYTALHGVPEVADAMAVEQRDPERPGSSRMVLLVVLRPGVGLDDDLARRIRRTLRQEASPAHVPSVVAAVPALPVTHNGKRSERAARDALNGDPVVNAGALRDPACLDANRAAVRAPAGAATPVATGAADVAADVAAGAPDTAVLRDLGRLWRDVLGGVAAGPADDFFDSGGTSRQVMSMLRRVALDLGVDVPVQDFLVEPTLAGLAAAVVRARSAGTPEVPLLRAGHGRPVFVLGDAWGQLNSYAALVARLDTERPVHGIQVPLAHEGARRPIGDVARDAVARLREVQSSGPYSLLGYSFGGIVAYEAATLLRAAGEPVGYLGLLDVLPPLAALTAGEARARRWVGRAETVLSGEGRAALARRLRLPARRDSASAEDDFFQGSYETANRWRPSPYAGPVTYYLAEGRPPLVGNSLAAWRRVAPHLLVTEVPGHHGDHDDSRPSVLSAQFVDTLAARVSATLH